MFRPKGTTAVKVSYEIMQDLMQRQRDLAAQVKILPFDVSSVKTIAGCDCALTEDQIFSVFVVFSYPQLEIIEVETSYDRIPLPYIPGFLAFREVPNLVTTYEKLDTKPDIIMVDGHGIAHPRRLGVASHLGVVLNKPTIGVAKSRLVGEFDPPGDEVGNTSPLISKGEQIGVLLRSKINVKPIFISPGHLCDQQTAVDLVVNTLRGHRLPEPTFTADKLSKSLKEDLKDTE